MAANKSGAFLIPDQLALFPETTRIQNNSLNIATMGSVPSERLLVYGVRKSTADLDATVGNGERFASAEYVHHIITVLFSFSQLIEITIKATPGEASELF